MEKTGKPGNQAIPVAALVINPAQFLLSICVLLFSLLIVDGYALALAGFPSDPITILVILIFEAAAGTFWLSRHRLLIERDRLELAGFVFVVLVTWFYVLYPSLPSLIPPSYSGDAANHVALTDRIFSTARIFGDYPGGPALVIATIAHWIGWLPVRLVHPLASLWIALSAGAIYNIACAILPQHRLRAATALFAPFSLYLPSIYFSGILVGPSYFMTQVAAQFFVVAFVAFLLQFLKARRAAWALGMGLCLVSIIVSFPLWLLLPLGIAGSILLWEWRQRTITFFELLKGFAAVLILPLAFGLAIVATGGYYLSTTGRLSAAGASIPPSAGAFGLAFLALAATGLLLLPSSGARAPVLVIFLVWSVVQTGALTAGKPLAGVSDYWINKSYNVWIYPLALFAVLPFDRLIRRIAAPLAGRVASGSVGLAGACVVFAGLVGMNLPGSYSPISESDMQAALWAKEHLDTTHINYIGAANLTAQWLVALWGERLPDDLYISFPALGPKTYEAWRDDADWGEYLLISDQQRLPLDTDVDTVYQNGRSAIVRKPPLSVPQKNESLGRFGNVFGLIDFQVSDQTILAGQGMAVSGHIETLSIPAHHLVWRLQMRDRQGNSVAEKRIEPFGNKFPLQRWPVNTLLQEAWTLDVPPSVAPGLYNLQLGLYSVSTGEPQTYASADGADDIVQLGHIKVGFPPMSRRELGTANLMNIQVGDAFRLLGYRLNTSPLKLGEIFTLSLYWQSIRPVGEDYTVFLHLLDSRGSLVLQKDAPPRDGTFPTSIWEANEIIIDPYSLVIPPGTPPGDYTIEVGMYQWPSLKRLPTFPRDAPGSDRILLPVQIRIER